MKQKLIIAGLVLVILIGIIMAGRSYFKMQETITRLQANQTTAINHNTGTSIVMTKQEFDEVITKKMDSLFKFLNIKSKNVTNYVSYTLKVKDTLLTSKLVVVDSTKIFRSFEVDNKCFNISGLVTPDTIIVNPSYKDNQTAILYWNRAKHIWFIKYGRKVYKAAIFSECTGDTIPVGENFKIIKR